MIVENNIVKFLKSVRIKCHYEPLQILTFAASDKIAVSCECLKHSVIVSVQMQYTDIFHLDIVQ